MFRRVEHRADHMHDVMQRLDVDIEALVRLRRGEAYAEARSRCLSCGNGDTCLRWLEQSSETKRPEFCPNLPLFDACERRD
jgi:hypothetical protein